MDLIVYIILGFIAELIDGCLGMAYGVFLTSCLTITGLPLVTISAGVHSAEVFVTLASGISHLKLGNVEKDLLKKLIIPGIIGGILGAFSLKLINGDIIKPVVSIYLFILGIRILFKAIKKTVKTKKETIGYINILGFFGGFLDAVGGGGWGPIVTSSLIAKGNTPRKIIGTVNLAEFFVTIVQSATFILLIGLTPIKLMLGITIGGIIAAPIAAWMCKKIDAKPIMIFVAITILLINSVNIVKWIMRIQCHI